MSETETDEKILTRRDGAVQWLIFNQPEKHNAISLGMTQRALSEIEAFNADETLRVLVLAGGGDKAFVSGADISEFDRNRHDATSADAYAKVSNSMFDAVYESPKPTIAMVNGFCFGGGVALAASCDIRYASDDALFSVPAAKLGIGYRVSFTKRILDIAGPARTREILYTGRRYDSAEALQMGLVNRVYPKAALEAEVTDIARTISENAPLSIRVSKATVAAWLSDPDARDLGECEALIAACSDSEDFKEGRRAFAEKRKPAFKGA